MAEVLASPVPGEGRVGSEEIVVVDLEAALGDVALEVGSVTPSDTQPATHTRSWFSRVFCGSENPLINVLKLLLLAMWATLGACSYIFQTGILAGISAGGFAFTLYFMVMPAVLQYLKEEMEASMTKKKNLIKKDRKSEILRFDKACPSLTVDDTTHPEDACSVCLADMALGERVRKLPCEHVFHTACLDEWWFTQKVFNMSCPLCRHSSCGECGQEPAEQTQEHPQESPEEEQQQQQQQQQQEQQQQQQQQQAESTADEEGDVRL